MDKITLFAESGVPVDIDAIVLHLNRLCSHLKFKKGEATLNFQEETIVHPSAYHNLDRKIVKETKGNLFAVLLTVKPYDNNYFFEAFGNLIILSFYGWRYLTNLSMNNGLVYCIADMLALEIDDSYRHKDITGCIFDFLWDKRGVDTGMRSSSICPWCLSRISAKKLAPLKRELFMDVRSILNELGTASKWNQDIVEYWKEQSSKGTKIVNHREKKEEVSKILKQNDFIPDTNEHINTTRSHLDGLCSYYLQLTDREIPTNKKGKIFEEFSKCLFGLIGGWKLVAQDSRLEDCEIDLIYDISNGPRILTERMGHNIYVECKNRKERSEVRDISHFILNLGSRNLKAGIFFSYSGITGYDPSNWKNIGDSYRRIIEVNRQQSIYVIPVVAEDIETIRRGRNLVSHLQDLLNRFIQV